MSNPVAYLAGTWKQIDQDNIDKQLEAQGKLSIKNYSILLIWATVIVERAPLFLKEIENWLPLITYQL